MIRVTVGRVGRAHGVHGHVAIVVLTDEPERRFAVGTRLDVTPPEHAVRPYPAELTVLAAQWHSGRLLMRFDGFGDRNEVEALQGAELSVEVDPLERPADPAEWYDHQLVGLAAFSAGGEPLGTVADVLHMPGQDCLEIATESGESVLVPFVSQIVTEIQPESGRLILDPPGELFPGPGAQPSASGS